MAVVGARVFANTYRDSVELMQIAAEIEGLPGIDRAGLVMATPANRDVLAAAGLATETAAAAGPNDLVVASPPKTTRRPRLRSTMPPCACPASGAAESGEATRTDLRTIAEASTELGGANLALISTPGTYATAEALKALKRGLNVFLFSDNVPIEDEIELKAVARANGPAAHGARLRDGDPRWRAAGVRERGPTRHDRPRRPRPAPASSR